MRLLDVPFLARRPRPRAGLYLSASSAALAVETPGSTRWRCAAVPLDGAEAAEAAMLTLCERLDVHRPETALVLAPEHYQLLLVEQPNVAPAELKEAVRWRIQESIDFPVETAVLDVFPFPESAARGRAPLVFVAAVPRPRLEWAVATARRAGLEPALVDIMELALRNLALRAYPSPEHGIGLLRITASSGLINLTRGDELFLSRRISGVPRSLDGAAWDQFKDALLLQVQRSIDYYESGLSQPAATALLVAATHGWQNRITEHLEAMLPLPVRSLSRVLADAIELELFNPDPVVLEGESQTDAEVQALAAAMPAIGGLLRLHTTAEAAA